MSAIELSSSFYSVTSSSSTLLLLFDWNEVARTLLCFSLFFLIIKYKQRNDSRIASIKKKILQNNFKPMPSPPAMPIIGHIHLLRDYQANPWEGFNEIRRQFGNVVSLKMGVHQMALVSSNEAMAEILLKKGDIFSNRPNFPRHHIIFGGDKENSLALCDWSNTHRDRRKLCKRGIVPNKFSSRNQLLEEIIIKHIRQFDTSIKQQTPQAQQFNPTPLKQQLQQQQQQQHNNHLLHAHQQHQPHHHHFKITKENLLFLTSDIFMEFLCKESHSHLSNQYKEFVLGCDFVFWDINQCYLIDFLPFLTSLGLGFSYLKRLKSVTDFLRDYIDEKIFDPRLSKYSNKNQNYKNLIDDQEVCLNLNDDLENKGPNEDYLDSIIVDLLTNKTSMSLADYKVGFADLLAGHAAVANILIRLLGHLALDQSIQDMICQESREVKLDEVNHMPALPVTEAALQEALRLASSPIVPHVAREDTSIDNFYIPQGTVVLFNNYHLNLSNILWTDPMDFNPRRFLKVNQQDGSFKLDKPKHFMPFSAGLRQCLGYKMVESTTILTVANLCKDFVIRANDDNLVRQLIAPKGTVALNPDAECFQLNLYPR